MKRFLVMLIILAWPLSAWGTTYYVSNAGNDSNNGTSTSTPWKTLAHAFSTLTGAQSDTFLLLNKGDRFRETVTVQGSGTSGHPFTIGSYGSGADPVIDGTTEFSASWTQYQGNIYDSSFSGSQPLMMFIDGATIQPAASISAMSAGTFFVSDGNLYIWTSAGTSPAGHTVEYMARPAQNSALVYDSGQSHLVFNGIEVRGSAFYGMGFWNTLSDITIQNCDFEQNWENDINFEQANAFSNITAENNTFENSGLGRAHGVPECVAISFGGITTGTISDNVVTNQGGEGIQTVGGDNGINIYGNTVNGTPYIGIYIGAGYCGGSTSNVNCCGNFVKNAKVQAFAIASETSGDNLTNIKFYYNIAEVTGAGLLFGNGDSGTTITNSLVANNVFYGGNYSIEALGPTTDASNVFENNILWPSTSWGNAWFMTDNAAHYSPDYNLIYGPGVSNLIYWAGTSYATLSAFQSAKGLMKHSISANPLFTNAAGGDFHIQSGSPAINAGISIGLNVDDFYGNSVPQNSAPDIGACQLTTSQVAAPTDLRLLSQ